MSNGTDAQSPIVVRRRQSSLWMKCETARTHQAVEDSGEPVPVLFVARVSLLAIIISVIVDGASVAHRL